jgi:hypothetical protein
MPPAAFKAIAGGGSRPRSVGRAGELHQARVPRPDDDQMPSRFKRPIRAPHLVTAVAALAAANDRRRVRLEFADRPLNRDAPLHLLPVIVLPATAVFPSLASPVWLAGLMNVSTAGRASSQPSGMRGTLCWPSGTGARPLVNVPRSLRWTLVKRQ